MRSHGDSLILRQRKGLAHDTGIAGVEAARDVGGGDAVHERRILAHRPRAKGLAQVGIEINFILWLTDHFSRQ